MEATTEVEWGHELSRHGLPTPHHVLALEEDDEALYVTWWHPAECNEDDGCAFEDIDAYEAFGIDYQHVPEGMRINGGMYLAHVTWPAEPDRDGEWDSPEVVIIGEIDESEYS